MEHQHNILKVIIGTGLGGTLLIFLIGVVYWRIKKYRESKQNTSSRHYVGATETSQTFARPQYQVSQDERNLTYGNSTGYRQDSVTPLMEDYGRRVPPPTAPRTDINRRYESSRL